MSGSARPGSAARTAPWRSRRCRSTCWGRGSSTRRCSSGSPSSATWRAWGPPWWGGCAAARERLREELCAAHDRGLSRSRALRAAEAEDFEPEWERPSHLAFRQALVFDVLSWCVAAHLPTPAERLPDIINFLTTAMTGEGERVAEFWMVKHLHRAAQQAT
ncbi:hypothetical protein [Streptomyces sp. NPDC059063]|uniref:hypothetical protein n=1 Tax=unclassified Streptomyces TaxID=2593676 RepID=UPI0036A24ADD